MFEINFFDKFTSTKHTNYGMNRLTKVTMAKMTIDNFRVSKAKCLKLKCLIILCQPNRVV
jgi:hypothetical protein